MISIPYFKNFICLSAVSRL